MGEKFFQTLKKLLVAIVRLFADGIAELHISKGTASLKVDLKRLLACVCFSLSFIIKTLLS